MPVTAAIVAGGAQALGGIYQQWRAGRMRKKAMEQYNNNPYQIPASATRSVNLAGRMAQGERLPGQDVIESNIAGNTAQGVNALQSASDSPSQTMRGMIDLYQNQQKQQQQLDVTAANDYQRRQGAYAQAVSSLAPYEVEKWKYKTLYPVEAQLNAASGMSAAGQQNMSQGIQSGMNAYGNGQYLKGMNTNSSAGASGGGGQFTDSPINQMPDPFQQNYG